MRRDELIARQDHVVYAIMAFVALLGLAWSLWQHTHVANPAAAATTDSSKAPAVWQSTTANR